MSDTSHHVLTGKVDITSNLLVGSSHLFVDTENNRVGLVTTDPQAGLHVNSNAYVNTDLRVGPTGPNQVVINATAGRIKAASFEGDGSLLQNTPPGAPGAAATIAVGTTTTGAAGSSASVTNSGSTSAAVFNFTIPKGDKGDTGDPGNDGANGADGADGANGADGTNYFVLSGSDIYRSTGNVGISTTTPMTKLDIAYNAAAPAIVFSDTTNSRFQTGIGSFHVSNEGQRLDFYTGDSLTNGTLLTDSPRMCITGTGNVGVNTSSPGRLLEVYTGNGTVPGFRLRRGAGAAYTDLHHVGVNVPSTGDLEGLAVITSDGNSTTQEVMRICGNGNVGVGSTSPTGRLEVEYTEGTLSSYSYATSSTWHNKGLALKGGNAGFLYGHDINHSIFLRQSPFGSTDHNAYCNVGYHAFYTGGHIQDQTEKMRIASDGVISISKYIEHKLISEASFVWDPSNTGTWNNHSNNIYNALGGNAYKATIIGGFDFHPDHIQATNTSFSIETDDTLDLRRSWTIVSWQRVTSGELTHIRVGGHGTTGGSQGLHIQGLGAEGMRYGMYSNDVDAGTNSGLRKTDKWAQYTATYSHTGTVNKKLYQNARLVADDRGTNTYNSSGTNGYPQYAAAPTKFRVGQSYSSGVYTTDSNTNLRVGPTLVFLDRVLDQSEVEALYEHYRMKYNGA